MRTVLAYSYALLVLTACQQAAPITIEASPGSSTPAAGTSVPALGIDLRVPPTRAARPTGSPSPSSSADATVTLADAGRTVTLRTGQRMLLNLGDELEWAVQIQDVSVLSRVPGVTVVRGAQGIYQANHAGQTALTATGEAACRKAQPACAQPSREFAVTIAVQ